MPKATLYPLELAKVSTWGHALALVRALRDRDPLVRYRAIQESRGGLLYNVVYQDTPTSRLGRDRQDVYIRGFIDGCHASGWVGPEKFGGILPTTGEPIDG